MQRYLAEFIAAFALIFIGGASILANTGGLGISLAHGLAIAAMVFATAHISGAHINPAVSIAMWATGRMKLDETGKYVVSQLAGAVFGAFLLSQIYGDVSGIVNNLGTGVSLTNGILAEAVFTFLLVFVIFAVAVDKRASVHHAALAIGFVIVFDHIAGLTLTGASMNPARTFGPALVSGMWTNHVVYWVGPVVGALVAAILYQKVFLKGKK